MEALGWDKHRLVNNEDVLEFLIHRKSELRDAGPPDTHFSYSNSNYALLALLIEKITGKKYADYLDENFFNPLQMKNTFVFKENCCHWISLIPFTEIRTYIQQ
jgi:CubicO group peptidase (beta-lactamase class C family)